SFGRMKPPADVSADTWVAMARLPEGRIDDMKLWPSPISLDLRRGSPEYIATLAMDPAYFCAASGSRDLVMKFSVRPSAGHACHFSCSPMAAPIGTSPARTSTSSSSIDGACGPDSTMILGGGAATKFFAT